MKTRLNENVRTTEAIMRALNFYADKINYIPTQIKEPRTAVHGDGGRYARDILKVLALLKKNINTKSEKPIMATFKNMFLNHFNGDN